MRHARGLGMVMLLVACGGKAAVTTADNPGEIIGHVEIAPDVPASGCDAFLTAFGGRSCDAAGNFHLTGLAQATYELSIEGVPDLPGAQRRLVVAVNAGAITDVGAVRVAHPGSIGGRLIGAGAMDLTQAIVGIPGLGVVSAPSDKQAFLLKNVPPGIHDVVLLTDSGSMIRKSVRVLDGQTTIGADFDVSGITAPRSVSVKGTAVRARGGSASGITVQLVDALTGKAVGTSVKTDGDGAFSIVAPRQGAYVLRARDGDALAELPHLLLEADLQLARRLVVGVFGDDLDGDGTPDATDPDIDGDGVPNATDPFPRDFGERGDSDGDLLGDRADLQSHGGPGIDVRNPTDDGDGDGKLDFEDDCPRVGNADQLDADHDGVGDACDNCPSIANLDQLDSNGDQLGDACPGLGTSCAARAAECGDIPDGTGHALNCGSCTAPSVCGGSGVPNRCSPTCATPTTCVAEGKTCGMIPDGCGTGHMLVCGTCAYPEICGGGGRPNLCGTCPGLTTCTAQQKNCGMIPDGCGLGGELYCGSCGPPEVCGGAGVVNKCGQGSHTLAVISGQDQMGLIDQELAPVVVEVDTATVPTPNLPVTISAPTGAAANPTTTTTNAMGQVTFVPTLGRVPGAYAFTVLAQNGGSVTVNATARAPLVTGAGSVVPVVNTSHLTSSALPVLPAPASQVRLSANIGGVVVASDGTLYVSDSGLNIIVAVAPNGVTRLLAGGSGFGNSGDYGPASAAKLTRPGGLALDETRQLLYVTDTGNVRVRAIDVSMSNGNMLPIAGGGTATVAPYGDGSSAANATFGAVDQLSLGPDGGLYIIDYNRGSIRRVDPTTNVITTWMATVSVCPGGLVALGNCNNSTCALAWDADGSAYLSGSFCTPTGAQGGNGIARRAPDGTLTLVAGAGSNPDATNNVPATTVALGSIKGLAKDRGGNLFFTAASRAIRRIDSLGTLTTVSGPGTAGAAGDYGPAAMASWSSPGPMAFDNADNLYITDDGVGSIRMLGKIGGPADVFTLAMAGGNLQTVTLDRDLSGALVPLSAKVADAAGRGLPGVTIHWKALDPGAYLYGATNLTTTAGTADLDVRVGLRKGIYTYQASLDDIHGHPISGSPVSFMLTATEPAAGTLFTIANTLRTNGSDRSGAASVARLAQPSHVVVANNGMIYFTDNSTIMSLSPAGELAIVAGGPAAGFSGDFTPAIGAQLATPSGLAIDATNTHLYVADTTNQRVRAIDLAPGGLIYTIAGGGPANLAPYGDGGPATGATLGFPNRVIVGSDQAVYVVEQSRNQLRRIDLRTGIISTVAAAQGPICNQPVMLFNCGNQDGCHLALAPNGNVLISGYLCGTDFAGGMWPGIAEVATGSNLLTRYAGANGATPNEALALTTVFGGSGSMAFDGHGNLFMYDAGRHSIRRIDAATRAVTTVLGSMFTTAGFSGDYVPAAMGQVSGAVRLAVAPTTGHLVMVDAGNDMLREVFSLSP